MDCADRGFRNGRHKRAGLDIGRRAGGAKTVAPSRAPQKRLQHQETAPQRSVRDGQADAKGADCAGSFFASHFQQGLTSRAAAPPSSYPIGLP